MEATAPHSAMSGKFYREQQSKEETKHDGSA
jgi:hypothetical protein